MPRYKTLSSEEAEAAVAKVDGLEPLVVDGKLQAIIVGTLRIYPNKDTLVVSQQEASK